MDGDGGPRAAGALVLDAGLGGVRHSPGHGVPPLSPLVARRRGSRTEDVTGFGEGVYVSDLFALAWTADVAAWWLGPAWYCAALAVVGRVLHGFMLFMVFNATIVYETGPIRWGGVALFAWLAWRLLFTFRACRIVRESSSSPARFGERET